MLNPEYAARIDEVKRAPYPPFIAVRWLVLDGHHPSLIGGSFPAD